MALLVTGLVAVAFVAACTQDDVGSTLQVSGGPGPLGEYLGDDGADAAETSGQPLVDSGDPDKDSDSLWLDSVETSDSTKDAGPLVDISRDIADSAEDLSASPKDLIEGDWADETTPWDGWDHDGEPPVGDAVPDGANDTNQPDIEVIPECPEPLCLLCRPCLIDADCNLDGAETNRCISFGPDGSFCGLACGDLLTCPVGYECAEFDDSAQCLPEAAQPCPCAEGFGDASTKCYISNDHGLCEALRSCNEPCPAAIPGPESCNGQDDNCSGETDEDLGTKLCGISICEHEIDACVDGKPGICDPFVGATTEVCNGIDDDCDGETDQGLGTISCGLGQCSKKLPACVDGIVNTCDAMLGSLPEVCNGLDDDCDGEIDEDIAEITCGLGECTHWITGCSEGKPGVCDPKFGAGEEVCNGKDDDCDGETDEDLGVAPCGLGPCAHEIPLCDLGLPGVCNPLAGASPETCNNKDDDCDGSIDENLGQFTCGIGPCLHSVPACSDGIAGVCDPLADATPEICNGIDDNCDGEVDNGLGQVTCGKGNCFQTIAACIGGLVTVCDPMAGSQPETCNGKDDDCDGEIDEALGQSTCGKGACLQTIPACTDGKTTVCDPLLGSGAEICNGIDDDCDGAIDEDLGQLTCGKGPCLHSVSTCTNGAVGICDAFAGAKPEVCNGIDDDCDGAVDEDLGIIECGTGKCLNQVAACVAGKTQTCNPKPSSPEVCNTIDDDCDGQINESTACPCPSAIYGGHVYLFCNTKVGWVAAKNLCNGFGGGFHLATITSAGENAFLTSTGAASGANAWWIGFTDSAKEGVWVWDNKEAVSWGPNWAAGEPNNSGNEDCGIISVTGGSGKWVDAGCYEIFPYICEK